MEKSKDMQNKAFDDGKAILDNLTWTQSKNSNSFNVERDSQGHFTDKEEVIPPMKLNLDASGYKNVPSL